MPRDDICEPHHDSFANLLTIGLVIGLVASYLPQHFKIINKKSSEGFSPWFLLLGSTSAASTMLNLITLQWGIIKCCRVLGAGDCIESLGAILQVSIQWFLFTFILILYMIYYPPHLKYAEVDVDMHDSRPPLHIKTSIQSDDWRLSITLSWVVFLHLALESFVTFLLVSPTNPSPARMGQIELWATFLGVTSAALAAVQYVPQVVHTYRIKLVGALSIPMMIIQTPGAVFMVLSIALRPGTNWTSWITYAVAGIMQGILLLMCFCWKVRQHQLRIDDFGHPLHENDDLLREPDGSVPVEAAVEAAVEENIASDRETDVGERTPLLNNASERRRKDKKGWRSWIRPITR